jgi:cytoskeletal protein CcmA (bactofilin family)
MSRHCRPGTLVVSEHARIDGEVHVVVNAHQRSVAVRRARTQANSVKNIHYKGIEIQRGAVIEGASCMAAEVRACSRSPEVGKGTGQS